MMKTKRLFEVTRSKGILKSHFAWWVADYGSNEGLHVNSSFIPVSGKYLQLKSTVHGLKLDKINARVKSCRFHASELTSYTSAPMV